MNALVITGPSGIGKSWLLAVCTQLPRAERVHVVDPFVTEPWMHGSWRAPSADSCAVIAFDHVAHLPRPAGQVAAAIAWCREFDKSLWLIAPERRDLDLLGIPIPAEAADLRLDAGPQRVTLTQAPEHRRFLPPRLLSFAERAQRLLVSADTASTVDLARMCHSA